MTARCFVVFWTPKAGPLTARCFVVFWTPKAQPLTAGWFFLWRGGGGGGGGVFWTLGFFALVMWFICPCDGHGKNRISVI